MEEDSKELRSNELLMLSNDYCCSSILVISRNSKDRDFARMWPVSFFLMLHSIELAIKSLSTLADQIKFGHDLKILISDLNVKYSNHFTEEELELLFSWSKYCTGGGLRYPDKIDKPDYDKSTYISMIKIIKKTLRKTASLLDIDDPSRLIDSYLIKNNF